MLKLGNGLMAERDKKHVTLYKNGSLLKRVDTSRATSRRLLIVELVNDMGASPTDVAAALEISRQTVYNTLDTYEAFGADGLLHSDKRGTGNKARQHEQRRDKARGAQQKITANQSALPLSTGEAVAAETMPQNFNPTHEWQPSRYAGGMIFSAVLEKDWNFTAFFAKAYGQLANVFIFLAQMLIHGIKSIEQLKAVKSRELGVVCGVERAPSRTTFSQWLHTVAEKAQGAALIKQFFVNQIKAGLVSCYILYADGNFIPYSGKERVHKGYFTQRRLAMPGQTNIVFHDATSRIVYFQLAEGNGDLRQAIEEISTEVKHHFQEAISPLVVSDRGSWGVEHFDRMSPHRLLTWEKYTNDAEIQALAAELFSESIAVNEHRYRFYEFPEKQTYWNDDKSVSVALRRIVIWNLDSNRRPVCVSNDTLEDAAFLGQAMLGRWGNSENGFKYMAERFNPHYIPLIQATEESKNQKIYNPIYKELETQKQHINRSLQKNANQLATLEEAYNHDGSVRANSKRQRLLGERTTLESELTALAEKFQTTPERTTLAEATDGKETFKVIDREGKNLFDLVQAMVWNARRTLTDMLRKHYHDERDVVNLLDHISRSHGWIKSTPDAVHVRLEPLDRPRFRAAQKELCASLNSLQSRLPNGKILKFSVGTAPTSVQKSGGFLG
ncbi:MAG: putative transposase [bacterium]